MIKTADCPKEEDLIRLNLGDMSGDQLEALCDHVESCHKCQMMLGQLKEPSNEFGVQLFHITRVDLENARIAIEAESFNETAMSIWGRVSRGFELVQREPLLSAPCKLRQYEVLRLIGQGPMGEVYEGRDASSECPIVLEVLHSVRQHDPVAYEHFLRKMLTAGQFEHPNLVRAYDAWEHEGCLFLAHESIDGDSLQQLASKGQIRTAARIIEALLGTCRALEQLHSKGFVHRDVKPANIMRLNDGTIKLIDYGLVNTADSGRSAANLGAGTIGYMSPEQAHGGAPIDNRSDIYSVGRVLKYLLSKLPDKSCDARQQQLVEQLTALADRLTQRDPENRPQSVYVVIAQLTQLQQSLKLADSPTVKSGILTPPSISRSIEDYSGASPMTGPQPSSTNQAKPILPTNSQRLSPGWIALIALLPVVIGLGGYQLMSNRDRSTIVLVENHQPGDVLRLSGQDGTVRLVELDGQPRFSVGVGTYQVSLEPTKLRRLNPATITVTGQKQLTVRIEDQPAEAVAD